MRRYEPPAISDAVLKEFNVVPTLPDLLHAVDAFGQALVTPPTAPKVDPNPVAPPGYYLTPLNMPTAPSPVDWRKQLIEKLVSWHNQLVSVKRASEVRGQELQRVTTRLNDANEALACSETERERLEGELATALHTIESLQHDLMKLGQEHADCMNRLLSEAIK